MKKLWVKIAVAVAAVLLLVLLAVPLLVRADSFRPLLQDQISSALGRKVTLGKLGFSPFSGSLVAENIAIADDPAFSTAPFLQAKKLSIGVETAKLLFSRKLAVTRLVLDTPTVQLIQTKSGVWNFNSLGRAPAPPTPAQPAQSGFVPGLTVGELKIDNGSATVSSLPATRKPFVYSAINVTVQQLSLTSAFPFQLAANLPAGGTLQINGTAGPFTQKDTSTTPFRAAIQLKSFDPVASGVVEPGKGISMVLDFNSQLASDGATLTSSGRIQAAKLHLARTGSPAAKPVDVDYSVSHSLGTHAGQIADIALHAGGAAAAHIKGSYQVNEENAVLDLNIAAAAMPIDQLESLLPAAGVTLPSGSSLKGGTLTANLTVKGPATAPVIEGPIEISNTSLAGFDIGSRIEGTNPFGGSGGGTEILTLRANLNSSPQSARFDSIFADLPQVGTASGAGSISSTEALDFQLTAQFTASTGVGAIASIAINAAGTAIRSSGKAAGLVAGLFGKKVQTSTSKGIPLTITGTAANPVIRANLKAML